MNIQKIPIDNLSPAQYNPRRDLQPSDAEYEKLKRSIETFGYVEPVIWNKTTGNVVGGHQRLKVLRDLGQTEIDCVVVELDDVSEKALNVALNKIQGEWDEQKLSEVLAELSATDLDVNLTGFNAVEIDALLRGTRQENITEDDFDIDGELKQPAVSKLGDVWQLGRHRLICGDSAKDGVCGTLMADLKANLVIAEAPDGVKFEPLEQTLRRAAELMHHASAIYLFHSDDDGLTVRKAFLAAGFHHSGTCIWEKEASFDGRAHYHSQHEPILFGWTKKGRNAWYSDRNQSTLWSFAAERSPYKPIALIAYPILNSSTTNGIIYDPFGMFGTTLIACEQTERICYAAALKAKHCDVIVKRYIAFKNSDADVTVLRGGQTLSYKDIAGGARE